MTWAIMTFERPALIGPDDGIVLVFGPVDAVKRSGSLLRKTWGEQIVGNAAIGLIGMLVGLVVAAGGGLLLAGAAATNSDIFLGSAIVIMAIALALTTVVFSALNAIYRAAVYEYAAEGVAAPQFGESMLSTAFQVKGQGGCMLPPSPIRLSRLREMDELI